MVATAAYSIVSIEFPYNRDKYIGFCQTAVGVGLLAGPFIGQTIFNLMGTFGEIHGYEYTFYVLASVLCISLVVASVFMPSHINRY